MHKILFTGGENIFTDQELKEINKLGLEIIISPPPCRRTRINKKTKRL